MGGSKTKNEVVKLPAQLLFARKELKFGKSMIIFDKVQRIPREKPYEREAIIEQF